jgi:hypothetical protein
MKNWQRLTLMLSALLMVIGAFSCQALAATTISGRASTVLEWRDNPNGDTATPAYQYLRINVLDLADMGWDFRGYGRAATDLSDEIDTDSRLYYAYLQKKGLTNGLDLKLGRQFLSTSAGTSLMDGIAIDYALPFAQNTPMSFSLFGGGDVSYYSNYSSEDLIVGGELNGRFLDSLSAGLSYIQRWGDNELANEMIGLDLNYDFKDMLNLYSEIQYDLLTESTSYFLAGANYRQSQQWGLRAEYLYSLPVFSSTSIYSVFAVNKYEEVMAELSYRVAAGLKAFGRMTYEIYPDFDEALVAEAGIEKVRTDRISGYLSGVVREDGDGGQDMAGVKARCRYMINQMFHAGAGIEFDVLQRRLEDDKDDTTSSRYWLDLTASLTKTINIEAKVERSESDLWDEYYQGRVRLNIIF